MSTQLSLFGEEIELNQNKNKAKTVISSSRRTDIPAFFYDWLQEALAKTTVEIPNPMFPDKTYVVDLKPSNVHSIVLWSKNFKNVLINPMRLNDYNLYFQYTINNYSRFLEPNVPSYDETIHTIEGLLQRYRPQQFNIRFDPVIISLKGEINPTPDAPEKARLIAFEQLCRDLKALGMEKCHITTSYISMYAHMKNKIAKNGFDLVHFGKDKQVVLFSQMSEISHKYGLSLFSCASPVLEQVEGINKGHCIDGDLLEKLFGGRVKRSKNSGQREACGCTYSRDVGIYSKSVNGMKCLHGCKYCYVI